MNSYLIGVDVLGEFGTGGVASVPLDEMGPGAGGTMYTDAGTIRAVQQALVARGVSVKVDGVFGPETEAALFKATGRHGPPNDAALAQLGVRPGGGGGGGSGTPVSYPQMYRPPGAPVPSGMAPPAPTFWALPLWEGAPVKRWQAALGAVGGVAVVVGLTAIVRR